MLEEDIRKKLNRPSSLNDVFKFKNELKKEILNVPSKNNLSISSTIELLNELVNDLIYSNSQKLTEEFIDDLENKASY